jgi:hypothetical protein
LLGSPGRIERRLQYRCTSRCLLLDAIEAGESVLLHQKRYKNSDEINLRRSNEAGRARNTFDGDNHWKPRSYWIGQSALAHPEDLPEPRISLQCDHVGVLPDGSELTLRASAFHEDWRAGHAEVRVRSDGSRFSVQ